MMRTLLLVLALTYLYAGCRRSPSKDQAVLPVDFQVFYELFHRDSSYQMEHIVFPLEGLPDYADPAAAGQKYYWEETSWTLHKPWNEEKSVFRKEILMPSDRMIVERLFHIDKPLMAERRFAKMGDQWYLIYYAGLNTYRIPGDQK